MHGIDTMKSKLTIFDKVAILVIIVGVCLIFFVSVGQAKKISRDSKAEGTTMDCGNMCTTYLPNSANYTENPDGCVKACNRVNAQIAKGKSCNESCSVLRPARAKVCQSVCEKAGIK